MIEDKIGTSEHGNQIDRYIESLTDLEKKNTKKIKDTLGLLPEKKYIIPVYFKMINQSYYDSQRYLPIIRKDVLQILNGYKFASMTLLEMFKENILNIQNESTNYLEIDSSKWEFNHCSGLYSDLKPHINTNNGFGYGPVNNHNGTFTGCWWYFLNEDTLKKIGITSNAIKKIYLQIERNSKKEFQLAIKMEYIPSEIGSNILSFENDIMMIDRYFNNSMKFNKKNRTNLLPTNKKGGRWVTLFKCPLNLNDFELTIQTCKEAEELLDSFKNT
ncbi:hypothetical protein BW731_00270 [Vagococcus martis]|uniref:Uncharacterized protein n=1 Tax=Vagococcus martis TaxID=1768210 RepID=A0A1V4DDX0_9ENTE|nr:hypothetical protein BW731_00270 [Vagococcus martis]